MEQKFFGWMGIFLVLFGFISNSMYGAIPAQECTATVDGKMNIFAAGRNSTNQYGGGLLPAQINLSAGMDRRLKFSTVGNNLSCCWGSDPHDADGINNGINGTYVIFPAVYLSSIKHYTRNIFLTGVFLDDSFPSGEIPPGLSYYSPLDQSQKPIDAISDQTAEFSPALKQIFFIGDGMGDSGKFQVFHVPNNATRLYLGFADACGFGWPDGWEPGCYYDNTGSILVTITSESASITVTSPNGGETWVAGSSHPITWTTTGNVDNVKIKYTTNNGSSWTTVTSSTANDGSYSWTVPNTVSSQCKIKISEASTGIPSDISDAVFSITAAPGIHLSRTKLNFGSLTSGTVTNPQVVSITNSGSGTLNWNISVDVPWLICTPGLGTGNGTILAAINSAGLTLGTYTGKVIISSPNAINSPQSVSVTLKVKAGSQYTGPFGEFATPVDGSNVRSSIPVTGWVLDDIEIQSVKLYREDGYSLVFIGDGVFVEGARPDVEAAYPDYPFNYKAGWGYMLLTNFLPGGDGVFKLHAVAAGAEGKTTDLGVKTITVDNAHAVKPFGAIDTPTQGGTASGKNFINFGWVLTPQPNIIPIDGSTINVWIDGVYIGHPVYNKYRADIAALFPGYANSNGAAGYFSFDTTAYKNVIHTIQWTATDSGGNIDGIGSRYFTVLNSNQTSSVSVCSDNFPGLNDEPPWLIPGSRSALVKKGYNDEVNHREIYPDEEGFMHIQCQELERIELALKDTPPGYVTGYLVVGDEPRPLPIGSTLDAEKGIFYWQPGPGFLGKYHLVFIERDETGPVNRKDVIISIEPYDPVTD
jgi:hypothetical protein